MLNYAKKRNHPHADAIHTAGWVSLFTLHVIWPFLWIWATLYQPERGWGMQSHVAPQGDVPDPEIAALSDRISRLEHQLAAEKKTDYLAKRGNVINSFRSLIILSAAV